MVGNGGGGYVRLTRYIMQAVGGHDKLKSKEGGRFLRRCIRLSRGYPFFLFEGLEFERNEVAISLPDSRIRVFSSGMDRARCETI